MSLKELEKLIFAIEFDEVEEVLYVYINNINHWETEGFLADYISDEGREALEPIIEKFQLCEVGSNVYEVNDYEKSILDIVEGLLEAGLSYDEGFQRFISPDII